MDITIKKTNYLIPTLIGLAVIVYLLYKWYAYSQCNNEKDSPCSKTSRSASIMREGGTAVTPLTDDEKATMNALAAKANSGTALTTAEWATLNALVYRYVKNGGTDPVNRTASSANNGKVKCSFWSGKSCE